jgi:hypothetical protein
MSVKKSSVVSMLHQHALLVSNGNTGCLVSFSSSVGYGCANINVCYNMVTVSCMFSFITDIVDHSDVLIYGSYCRGRTLRVISVAISDVGPERNSCAQYVSSAASFDLFPEVG